MMKLRAAIVITGDVLSGFSHYGPFPNGGAAATWADETFGHQEPWTIANLYEPSEAEEE